MPASNIYSVLSDATTPSQLDWADIDDQENVYHKSFNLPQLRKKLGAEAVFTKDLLQEIRHQKVAIQSELQRAPRDRKLFDLTHKTRFGEHKVWDDSDDEESDTEDTYNCVSIRLMSRIELHPAFQANFWKFSKTNRILRRYNELQSENVWAPVPYILSVDTLISNKDHQSTAIMRSYWHALVETKRLWLKSSSRQKIMQMADKLVFQFKPITKIVCFGLGAFNHDKAFYESSLQHMTAFTIASHLENAYQKKYAKRIAIEIILQDPCYTLKDQLLLRRMYPGTLKFASDPDGLLAIDSNTIVLTAFLPVSYPLMQVLADLFGEKKGKGPAAIIGDAMELNPARELYALVDRSSPEVARFLTDQYLVSNFKDHVLEPELAENVHGGGNANRPYWLSRMHLQTRKNRDP